MARGLGLDVVAEGVETQEQLDFLQKAGCRLVQGYLFARPMSAQMLETTWQGEATQASATLGPSPAA